MSFDIVPFDWPRRFFGKSKSRRGFFGDMFREFDEMMHEMERKFEDVEKWTSEEFVKGVYYYKIQKCKRGRTNGL